MSNTTRFKVDKLIRDNMPDILRGYGITVYEKQLDHPDYIRGLKDKLKEECDEALSASEPEAILEELADLTEVIIALAEANGYSHDQLRAARIAKKELKGGFENRTYNAFIEIPTNNPKAAYYRAQPDKYPEMNDY